MTNSPATEPIRLDTGLEMLQHVLEEEIHQYEAIIEKLNCKQAVLVEGKPQTLNQIDQELMALSRNALKLEKQRLSLMARMGYPKCSLSAFIAQLQPDQAAALNRRRERLLRAVNDMHRLNQDTSDLLDLSIQWIQETVELIAGALAPEGSSYTAHGNKPHAQNPGTGTAPGQSTIIRSA